MRKETKRWEFPEWVNKIDNWLYAVMPMPEIERVHALVERLSELCDQEEDNKSDVALLYGIAHDKEVLIKEIVSVYEKYRKEAEQFSKNIKL